MLNRIVSIQIEPHNHVLIKLSRLTQFRRFFMGTFEASYHSPFIAETVRYPNYQCFFESFYTLESLLTRTATGNENLFEIYRDIRVMETI